MANMIPISTVTVGSGGASAIEFTSIPQTYTDLNVLLSIRSTAAYVADDLYIQLNSNGSNFTYRNMYSTGNITTTAASSNIIGSFNGVNSSATVFSNSSIYIPNYTSSNNKSLSFDGVVENNATRGDGSFWAVLWSNTAAITSIKLYGSLNFAQYSSATLYGIRKY